MTKTPPAPQAVVIFSRENVLPALRYFAYVALALPVLWAFGEGLTGTNVAAAYLEGLGNFVAFVGGRDVSDLPLIQQNWAIVSLWLTIAFVLVVVQSVRYRQQIAKAIRRAIADVVAFIIG